MLAHGHKVRSASRPTPSKTAPRRGKASPLNPVWSSLATANRSAPSLQRTCDAALGAPKTPCSPSVQGVIGWSFNFKAQCDELLPGEEANAAKFKAGSKLKVHGFSAQEGTSTFQEGLACHRANRVAELLAAQRPECPVVSKLSHGTPPASDTNPAAFWHMVNVEEIKPDPHAGALWLDPNGILADGWTVYNGVKAAPTSGDLDQLAKRRKELKAWLEDVPNSLAPTGNDLSRLGLVSYRKTYAGAEDLWRSIDALLTAQKHSAATTDTYASWAAGTGSKVQSSSFHAQNVPAAKYHVDLFGEGYYPGAVNIGRNSRTSTTGVAGSRTPNLIYRNFSGKLLNHLPIADKAADLVTSENGPLALPGLAAEIARITAPGGTIVLYGPDNVEPDHDAVAAATQGGTVSKKIADGAIETTIVMPSP